MYKKRRSRKRSGATAVEMAFATPVIFLMFFSAIEISRLMMADGNVTSAMLIALRHTSLLESTQSEVEQLVREELSLTGVSEFSIAFNPQNFDADDPEVDITLFVPVNAANGFAGTGLVAPNSNISKTIRLVREKR